VLHGKEGRRTCRNPDLGVDVLDMPVDGLLGNDEETRDLLHGMPSGDHEGPPSHSLLPSPLQDVPAWEALADTGWIGLRRACSPVRL
jgi:hypothetical protein